MEERQQAQKRKHDSKARERSFQKDDLVFVKNFGPGPQWISGRIIEISGPVSYVVQLDDGRQRRCHQDHLRARIGESDTRESMSHAEEDSIPPSAPTIPSSTETTTTTSVPSASFPETGTTPEQIETPTVDQTSTSVDGTGNRYPRRNRKPREHFEPGN